MHGLPSTACVHAGALPVVPAVLLGVLGVSGQGSSHGELVLKDSTGDIICEVKEIDFLAVM